jgi:hypothetical protein
LVSNFGTLCGLGRYAVSFLEGWCGLDPREYLMVWFGVGRKDFSGGLVWVWCGFRSILRPAFNAYLSVCNAYLEALRFFLPADESCG